MSSINNNYDSIPLPYFSYITSGGTTLHQVYIIVRHQKLGVDFDILV